mgnify:CR=1 FL=1|jgi:hypothetical protein
MRREEDTISFAITVLANNIVETHWELTEDDLASVAEWFLVELLNAKELRNPKFNQTS